MQLPDYIKFAQTNLLRTKLRTFLTVLALFIGTFTLAMTTGLGTGLTRYATTQINAFTQPDTVLVSPPSRRSVSSSGIPEYDPKKSAVTSGEGARLTSADVDKLKTIPNVTGEYPSYFVQPEYIQYGTGKKYVVSVNSLHPQTQLTVVAGSVPAVTDSQGMILPFPYVAALGFAQPSDAVGKTVTIRFSGLPVAGGTKTKPTVTVPTKDMTFIIRGVLSDTITAQNAFLAPSVMEELSNFQHGNAAEFFSISLTVAPHSTAAVLDGVKAAAKAKGYDAMTPSDLLKSVQQGLLVAQIALDGFAAIALLAALIGIVNTLLMAVLERTQEIGLLKALGMQRKGIFGLFVYEAVSIGFWGGLLGTGVAMIVGPAINSILSHTLLKGTVGLKLLVFPLPYMAAIIGLGMLIGFVAGALPAARASRLNPIDALRSE